MGLSIKSEKTASSWQRKETEGTPQKQLPKPTTPYCIMVNGLTAEAVTYIILF